MELIPILSLIILVATISTFILAVGAYILYKIRERKGKGGVAQQPSSIEAELITPSRVVADVQSSRTTGTGEQIYTRNTKGESIYTNEEEREPHMRPTFVAPRETRATRTNATRYSVPLTRETNEGERYTSAQKFKRYGNTSDTQTKEVKKEESLKWR
ncbi:MAG: hypothetical protein KKF62_11030 [Bacteroidetes bacterium]|nr:hypothetical protein [Bacteroidota bacterium]MBU1115292.1 hypothetical protein [Bacteroidota bacterium]MBU1800152.1 hypothetical protein [Bacteroidota bacterium]